MKNGEELVSRTRLNYLHRAAISILGFLSRSISDRGDRGGGGGFAPRGGGGFGGGGGGGGGGFGGGRGGGGGFGGGGGGGEQVEVRDTVFVQGIPTT